MSTPPVIPPRRLLHIAFLILATLCPPAGAQEANPAAGDDAAILPFIDEGTFVVARLDVDRVDQDAFGKFAEGAIDTTFKNVGIPADQLAQMRQEAVDSIGSAKTWLTDMSAAGGKRVYVLIDQADQATPGGDGPVVIVPVGEGGDAEKILAKLTGEGTGSMAAEQVGKAVVLAQQPALDRVKKLVEGGAKPAAAAAAARPDLARAFGGAGKDAPLRVAFVPGEMTRKWIEESLPKLPEPLGGGDTKLLSRGVLFAGIEVAQKPETLAKVSVQAADASQAKALLDVLNKGAQFMKQLTAGGPMAAETAKQVDAFKPTVDGETVRFSVDPAVLMTMTSGVRMTAEVQVTPPGQPAQPAKPDDGEL